ncbi:hypothetical protein SAMN04487787_104343 [Kosakonia sacchari]|nr:hypothetical protein SAMN04487787_104343 [Kosakonia sacchari]
MAFADRHGKDHRLRAVVGIVVRDMAWYRPLTRGWISTRLSACATLFRLAAKTVVHPQEPAGNAAGHIM